MSRFEHDRSIRQMPIHVFPYHIVFANLIDTIEGVAFAHNRRRPAYFVKRLRRCALVLMDGIALTLNRPTRKVRSLIYARAACLLRGPLLVNKP